jgi:DNA-binding NarL/FixJ family response regulator
MTIRLVGPIARDNERQGRLGGRRVGMRRPRILLAEDHPAVAADLRGLLEPEFEVIAVVDDGYAVIGAAQSLKPDIIVADISLPGMDGISAAEQVLKQDTKVRVIFVTVHNDPAVVERAMGIGASGYLLKVRAGEELVPAVRSVVTGEGRAT